MEWKRYLDGVNWIAVTAFTTVALLLVALLAWIRPAQLPSIVVPPDSTCAWAVCFAPLSSDAPVFFGFGEYLASLALMVLAWTIAESRYRFRVMTAPLPMDLLTFAVVGAVGGLTLLTDLWRAQEWLVPVGPLPPAVWQALLGGSFLATFLAWAWYGFIRPPRYGKRNARRYAEGLYRTILKGAESNLAVAADELSRSARELIKHASNPAWGEQVEEEPDEVRGFADDILMLIADRRFCRVVVASSPTTIGALFQAVRDTRKHRVPLNLFGRNIVREAITNKDSFLYHESSGFESGLLGYHKPLTTVMFADFEVVDGIGSTYLLDPGYFEAKRWDEDQWGAYCRMVLTAVRGFAESGFWWGRGWPFSGPFRLMETGLYDLYTLDGADTGAWKEGPFARLGVILEFVQDGIDVLEDVGVPDGLRRRVRDEFSMSATLYDRLANLIAEIVFAAGKIRSTQDFCWLVQHNAVWGHLMPHAKDSRQSAWGTVLFKVRRLLYDEIVQLEEYPNFKGAAVVGFCLNVLGLNFRAGRLHPHERPLQKAVLRWTKANYSELHKANPRVAEACLVEGIAYDETNNRLMRTYPAKGISLKTRHEYLDLAPPPPMA